MIEATSFEISKVCSPESALFGRKSLRMTALDLASVVLIGASIDTPQATHCASFAPFRMSRFDRDQKLLKVCSGENIVDVPQGRALDMVLHDRAVES